MAKTATTSTKQTKVAKKADTAAKSEKGQGRQLIGENTKFTITIAWKDVEKAQQNALENYQGASKMEGFRKGKAPTKLIAQNLGEKGLRDLTLEKILPDLYRNELQKNSYLPLTDPEVFLDSVEANKDWSVSFVIALPPEIKLDGYEKIVQDLKKKHEAWKEEKSDKKDEKTAEAQKTERRNAQINAVIEALLEKIDVVIPELLLRTETRRRLEDFARQLEQNKVSLQDYLNTTKKSLDTIQQEMAAQGLLALQVELLLGAIIRRDKLTIDHDLVHQALPHDREVSREEHDYVESILMKQRAVDHLLAL